MRRIPSAAVLAVLLSFGLGAQEADSGPAAKAALQKLCDRFRDLRFLSAGVVQTRRTELLDRPIVSSGKLYYRRDPARLVFQLGEPRKVEIHMDRTSYQVYRADERRLERFEFGADGPSAAILMVFEPKMEALEKNFSVRGGGVKDGVREVALDTTDERLKKRLKGIVLRIAESDATLRGMSYTDAEGDDVRFELSDVALNAELEPSRFDLKTADGTRVILQSLKPDK